MRSTEKLALVNSIGLFITERIASAMAGFGDRLLALEARKPEPAQKGDPGEPGEPAPPITEEQLATAVQKYLAANPPPKGDPGQNADPVTEQQIAAAVTKHLSENPPKDGISIKGNDGRGIASALIDVEGNLVLTFTDGTIKTVGCVQGKDGIDAKGERGDDGKDGIDGKDGFGFDDFDEAIEDGGRFIVRTYKLGERVKVFRHKTKQPIYRGVFTERDYDAGDLVTWGGATWHANEETKDKPGNGTKAWTLAVKPGRDGKDGAKGEPGAPGRHGKDGKWV